MTPEQREELKQAAQRLYEADESNDTISAKVYTTMTEAFFERATPAAILSLIAQVEAQATEHEKLLNIIASAYQIAGKHDAPARVLDVLADPLAATEEQVEAMLPYQVEALTVPPGYRIVPVEPTPAMLERARNAPLPMVLIESIIGRTNLRIASEYGAMLDAAPTIHAIPGTKEGA